ncbi:MAG: hypothetical protein M4D80_13760 [Myxococcota bacterium]|nr:hypothetical protein [Myxococcota bacterium]
MLALTLGVQRADAQVSDEANCGTSLPACSALRLSCCTRDFASTSTARTIFIPMDRCHQPYTNASGTGADVGDAAPLWCSNSPSFNTNAQNYAYGLVYRLMQNKVPVHWIVNPTKAPSTNGITATSIAAQTKDVDFWITTATGVVPGPAAALTGTGTHVRRLAVTNIGTPSLTYSTATPAATGTYSRDQFPVRASAFVIAPEDRVKFDNFMKSSAGRTTCGSGNDCYDFINNNGVFLYEVLPGAKFVWQDYTQPLVSGKYVENANTLPVALRIDYQPPKVAVIPGTTMLSAVLANANLDDIETTASCKAGTFTVANKIGCQLTEADVVLSNRLVSSSFNNAWVDLSSPASCSNFMTKLQTFATSVVSTTNGGNIIMFGDSIDVAEQCATSRGALLGRVGTGLTMHGSSVNDSDGSPYIIRYPSNVLAQYGDLPLNFASGSVKAWDRVGGGNDLYNTLYTSGTGGNTLRRLMTQEVSGGTFCSNHRDTGAVGAVSAAGCDSTANNTSPGDFRDAFAYGRYLNNRRHGIIFYSPGQNPNTNPTKSHMKLILGTMIAVPPFLVDQVFTNIEVTRSSPIVAAIGGTPSIVQGTYEYHYKTDGTDQFPVPRTIPTVFTPDDVANFSFPALIGHLRGVATASVDVTPTDLGVGTSTMNASTGEGSAATDTFPPVVYAGCAPPYDGTCRGVWTTTTTGATPAFQQVNEGNTAVSALMLPEATFAATNVYTGRTYRADFVRKILKGYDNGVGFVPQLGGIDRSTVAVIGPGASVGGGRATIAYVGGTDGMVHAICASDGGAGCTRVGMELWAYIPRTNLPQLRYNQARVDGSARVLDVKLTTGSKTVLLIQAGLDPTVSGSTPAIYALDVTDPQNPALLWEYATWDSAGTGAPSTLSARPVNGLGVGLSLAAGQATIAAATKNIVIAQTNNGGTGNNGNYVIALDIQTGTKIWDRFNAYPSTTISAGVINRGAAPTINIPASAIPPGAVPVDKTFAGRNGFMTDIVIADLYGNLWLLNPANGTSRTLSATSVEIPLFQFATDYHPLTKPAIYTEGGVAYAAFTTGGYHDYTNAAQWGFNTPTQYLMAVNLNSISGTTPLIDTTSPIADIPVKQTITGSYGFSQVRVVDEAIYATTDTTNINLATFGTGTGTGRVLGYNVVANAAITNIANTQMGASTIANDGNDLFVASGSKRQQLMNMSTGLELDSTGTPGERTTAPAQVTSVARKLWLRTE